MVGNITKTLCPDLHHRFDEYDDTCQWAGHRPGGALLYKLAHFFNISEHADGERRAGPCRSEGTGRRVLSRHRSDWLPLGTLGTLLPSTSIAPNETKTKLAMAPKQN